MEKKIYQVVVKYNATNKISVYDFEDYTSYKKMLEEIKQYPRCIIITTNMYLTC